MKKLIENINDMRKSLNEISVYDLNVYSAIELYYKLALKTNEVITELSRFEGVISDEIIEQNEKLTYLLGEGLNNEVVNKINDMLKTGVLDELLNNRVFSQMSRDLAEKPYRTEVFLKKDGININDFDNDTRETFLNAQGISVNYTLTDNSVKYNHLTPGTPPLFLEGINYFENLLIPSLFSEGGLNQDGSINTSNTSNYVSDFIKVTPDTTYYRWYTNPVVVGYYDENKNHVNRPTISDGVKSFSIPHNVHYIRYTTDKNTMNKEIISSKPIAHYHKYRSYVYELNSHYQLMDNSLNGSKLENKSITQDKLSDRILGNHEILNNNYDLDNFDKDGWFICTDVNNKPSELGTCYLTNKVIFSYDNPRWVIQELIDFNNPYNKYIRTIDLENSSANKEWVNINNKIVESVGGELTSKKILCLGDSITQGVNASSNNTTYPAYLKNKYGMDVTNVGIAGSTWANYGDGYDDISIISQVDKTDFSKFDFVTIFAGTNDFGRDNGDTIGNATDTATNTVKGAMNYVFNKILTQNPRVKIAVITPMWRQRFAAGDNKDSDTNTLGGQYLKDYVNAIEEQSRYNHIPCLNLYETCLINKYNYSTYLSDGLHPNDKGYELLADKIHSFLESVY